MLIGFSRTGYIALLFAASCRASAATPAVAQEAAPLQQYTAPDQTASVGLPAGWHVTKAGNGLIDASGPNGESVDLGRVIIARDAPFQPRGTGGAAINLPYTATLDQKFMMIVKADAEISGKQPPQMSIASTTPLQLPAEFGQCASLVGSSSEGTEARKFKVGFCSMPRAADGRYKNIFKLAMVPARIAAQQRPTLEAVMRSFRMPQNLLGQLFAPPGAAPQPGAAPAVNSAANPPAQSANANAECFDLVFRETPKAQLPQKCGGSAGHN